MACGRHLGRDVGDLRVPSSVLASVRLGVPSVVGCEGLSRVSLSMLPIGTPGVSFSVSPIRTPRVSSVVRLRLRLVELDVLLDAIREGGVLPKELLLGPGGEFLVRVPQRVEI